MTNILDSGSAAERITMGGKNTSSIPKLSMIMEIGAKTITRFVPVSLLIVVVNPIANTVSTEEKCFLAIKTIAPSHNVNLKMTRT